MECTRCKARAPISRPLIIRDGAPEYSLPVGWSPFVVQTWGETSLTQVRGQTCPSCTRVLLVAISPTDMASPLALLRDLADASVDYEHCTEDERDHALKRLSDARSALETEALRMFAEGSYGATEKTERTH